MYEILAEVTNFTEVVTPYLPVIGVAVGGIVVGVFAAYNRRKGNTENRAPDVNELWQQQAADHRELVIANRLTRQLELHLGKLWEAFVAYVRRVQSGGSTELTTKEQKLIDMGTDIGQTEGRTQE